MDGAVSAPARVLHGRDAATQAIKDLEEAMNDIRMAGISVTAACMRDESKLKAARCSVPTKTLALAGQARILAAAQQPSPASLLEDMYGPLFPFNALDASDAAVQRVEAVEANRLSNAPPVNQGGDPLAVAHVVLPEQGAPADGEPQRSGSISSAMSGIGRRMRMPGMRRSGNQDDDAEEDEQRGLGGLGGSSRPQRAPQQPAPAAAAVDPGDALAAPAAPPPPAGADPLGDPLGGGGLGPGPGFGVDPLSAPRVAARPPPPQNGQHDDDDDLDEPERQAPPPRAAPLAGARQTPRAPGPRPRPAPPAPGGGVPRAAPPPPGIGGRPAPLRSAPGRPAPLQSRPAPPRAAPGRDLPL